MDVLVKVRVSDHTVTMHARSQTDNVVDICLQITALGYRRLQWQQRFASSLSIKTVVQRLAQQLGVSSSLCQLYLQKLQLQDQTLDQVSILLRSSSMSTNHKQDNIRKLVPLSQTDLALQLPRDATGSLTLTATIHRTLSIFVWESLPANLAQETFL